MVLTSKNNLIKPTPIIQKLLRSKKLGLESYFEEQMENNNMIYLDKNENPFAPPLKLIEPSDIIDYLRLYPDPSTSDFLNNLALQLNIPSSYLLVGSGSDDLLDLIIRTYATRNVKILGVSPSFSMYEFYAKINGAEYISVPLILRLNQKTGTAQYELDQSNFINKAKDSKIIILARPNNPDGMVFRRDFIIKLLGLNQLVIIDEAYIDFSDKPSLIDLIQRYDNLIITRSFSKSYSLAGLRLGYIIANPEIINVLNQVKSPYNVNNIALKFGVILINDQSQIMKNITKVKSIRKEFCDDLMELIVKHKKFYYHPSEANFVLLRGQSIEIIQLLYEYFLKCNFKPRKFKGQLENCLRISIGTKFQMKKVIEIIDTFLGGG